MLNVAADALSATSPATATAGADAQLIAANSERNGLTITLDTAATAPLYLLLGSGVSSAVNFHYAVAPGGSWNGLVSGVLWRGAVRGFSSAGGKVGIAEV